jgi:histidinol-phosphatase
VTEADKEVENAIREGIVAARPDDAILGEEFGSTGPQDGEHRPHRQWIIDPIDGTANFLRGVPIWGTLIALAVDGVPVVGVVSAPALGQRPRPSGMAVAPAKTDCHPHPAGRP